MGLYDRLLLPRLIDVAMRGPDIDPLRAALLAQAKGRTLEVGFGTGLNARHYPREVELTVIDDNAGMNDLARSRLQQAGRTARHEVLSGERLPFADASFDTVVVTFTLCSIPDVGAAIREMRRVLAPGGQLLFLEHGLAPSSTTQAWQHRLNLLWKPVSGGCHLDRDPEQLLRDAGFDVAVDGRTTLPVGALLGSVRFGRATVPPP
jgi:ubiquinone/menaquinone biosynthesis C-methylase UbiE